MIMNNEKVDLEEEEEEKELVEDQSINHKNN